MAQINQACDLHTQGLQVCARKTRGFCTSSNQPRDQVHICLSARYRFAMFPLSWSTTSSCHDIPVLFLFPKTVLQNISKRNPQRPSMYLSKEDVVKLRCGGPRGCGSNLRHSRSTLGVLSDCCYDSSLPETYFGTKGNNFTVLSPPHLIQTSAANPVSY